MAYRATRGFGSWWIANSSPTGSASCGCDSISSARFPAVIRECLIATVVALLAGVVDHGLDQRWAASRPRSFCSGLDGLVGRLL